MKFEELVRDYPEIQDIVKVFEFGELKHPRKQDIKPNWLESDGNKSSFKDMHDSMFHHLAESFASNYYDTRGDIESDLDPLLHLIVRALMIYIRINRDIKHPNDVTQPSLDGN